MERHFQKEVEGLKTTLIKMGSLAEAAVVTAIKAMVDRDCALADKVIEGDDRINSLEIEVDEAIIDLLALQQPVASDLRLILAAQKINNDLERIGDHAVNLAESVLAFTKSGKNPDLMKIPEMVKIVESMLRDALDGFIHKNAEMARSVLERDDEIDALNVQMAQHVIESIKKNQLEIEAGVELIRVSRNLERVADLSTNIAEEVIFIANASVVKHHALERERLRKSGDGFPTTHDYK